MVPYHVVEDLANLEPAVAASIALQSYCGFAQETMWQKQRSVVLEAWGPTPPLPMPILELTSIEERRNGIWSTDTEWALEGSYLISSKRTEGSAVSSYSGAGELLRLTGIMGYGTVSAITVAVQDDGSIVASDGPMQETRIVRLNLANEDAVPEHLLLLNKDTVDVAYAGKTGHILAIDSALARVSSIVAGRISLDQPRSATPFSYRADRDDRLYFWIDYNVQVLLNPYRWWK